MAGFPYNGHTEIFAEQTGRRPFKFTVDMVATVKAVKEKGDEAFTLGDLLDVYYGKKVYARYDQSALQWNRFVQDFFADEATRAVRRTVAGCRRIMEHRQGFGQGEKIHAGVA